MPSFLSLSTISISIHTGCRMNRDSSDSKNSVDEALPIKARIALLSAVEDFAGREVHSADALIRLFAANDKKYGRSLDLTYKQRLPLLLSTVKNFKKAQLCRFFSGLNAVFTRLSTKQGFLDNNDEQGTDSTPDESTAESISCIEAMALCVLAYYETLFKKDRKSSYAQVEVLDEAAEVAQALHDILFQLHALGSAGQSVSRTILKVCFVAWTNNIREREYLMPQSIPLFVVRVLGDDEDVGDEPRKSALKDLFQVREALELFDFLDESTNQLSSLLLRLISAPDCLSIAEGKRFISYLFSLDSSFRQSLHDAIKAQVPHAKKAELTTYGEAYMRAWKDAPAEGVLRESIEDDLLKDLAFSVLHIENPAMFRNLMNILQPVHNMSNNVEGGRLLHRLYSSIIWRSAQSAHYIVRKNVAVAMSSLFPLMSPHLSKKQSVEENVSCLRTLLTDSVPAVRVAASQTVAFVLSNFWEGLTAESRADLLNVIVSEHSSDKSSVAVRVSAINAICSLIKVPETHAALRTILPQLGNLIHDQSESVRSSVVKLLLKVKAVGGIKYFHVVPVDHLLARLTIDGSKKRKSPVCSSLTLLMLNSYIPQGDNVTSSEQIQRTIKFLETDPEAAVVFYSNVAKHMPADEVVKILYLLVQCFRSAVDTIDEDMRLKTKHGQRKSSATSVQAMSENDSILLLSMADICFVLCESVHSMLTKRYEESTEQLLETSMDFFDVEGVLGFFKNQILNLYENTDGEDNVTDDNDDNDTDTALNNCWKCWTACINIASKMKPDTKEGCVAFVYAGLEDILEYESSSMKTSFISSYLSLLCLWDYPDVVATSLADALQHHTARDSIISFSSPINDKTKKRRTRSSSSQPHSMQQIPILPAKEAVLALQYILSGQTSIYISARSCLVNSESAMSSIDNVLETVPKTINRLYFNEVTRTDVFVASDVQNLLNMFDLYLRFLLHRPANISGDEKIICDKVEQLTLWLNDHISSAGSKRLLDDPDISHISFEQSFTTTSPTPLSPLADGPVRRRRNKNSTPGKASWTELSRRKSSAPGTNSIVTSMLCSMTLSLASVISEWIKIRGTIEDNLLLQLSKLLQLFNLPHNEYTESLTRLFLRLAAQLVHEGQPLLLEELLLNMTTAGYTVDIASQEEFAKSILKTSPILSKNYKPDSVIPCIVKAAKGIATADDTPDSFELAESLVDVGIGQDNLLYTLYSDVVSKPKLCSILVEHLVDNLTSIQVLDQHSVADTKLELNLLAVILHSPDVSIPGNLCEKFGKLNANVFDTNEGIQCMYNSISSLLVEEAQA